MRNPRFSSAFLRGAGIAVMSCYGTNSSWWTTPVTPIRIESSQGGQIADADWADLRGGTSEQVALRFAEALAIFLEGMRKRQCSQPPPNEILQPTSGAGAPRR